LPTLWPERCSRSSPPFRLSAWPPAQPPLGGAPAADVAPIVGTYVELSTFEERTVRVGDGKAWLGAGDGSPETEIVAVQKGILYMNGFTTRYAFEPGDARRASRLVRIGIAKGEDDE